MIVFDAYEPGDDTEDDDDYTEVEVIGITEDNQDTDTPGEPGDDFIY